MNNIDVFNTPILLITFNRPENTKSVFDKIRTVRPKIFYISCDAPRQNVESDIKKVELVKSIVSEIDWDCDVHYLFQNENLGCNLGPRSAIDWFFNEVEYGIILEDDCLPSISFFLFCQEILVKYRNDTSVMAVTGTNITTGIDFADDYWFSKYALMWGWATWNRSWALYDPNISDWNSINKIRFLKNLKMGGVFFIFTWFSILQKTYKLGSKATWWDYQWIFTCWKNNGLVVAPKVNLIKNIGFSSEATHTKTKVKYLSTLELNELSFPLNCGDTNKTINTVADLFISKFWFGVSFVGVLKILIKDSLRLLNLRKSII